MLKELPLFQSNTVLERVLMKRFDQQGDVTDAKVPLFETVLKVSGHSQLNECTTLFQLLFLFCGFSGYALGMWVHISLFGS